MAGAPERLEWSLPVPNVQELHRLGKVPSRFLRDDEFSAIPASSDASSGLRVPLIDMIKLANSETRNLELQKLNLAAKDWGLFQVINHGVPDEIVTNIKTQAKAFFDLPFEEKRQCAQMPGYLEGYGQSFVTSEEQKLDWHDMLFLRVLPLQDRRMEFWPKNPKSFRKSLQEYTEELREVAVNLIKSIIIGLGIGAQELCKAYQLASYEMRMNYYPPCPEPERVIGISPHCDISGITFLLDCGHTPGLQVLNNNRWVIVEPMDNAIVVNLGQITQIMSNGIYKAPYHRAVVSKLKQRLSIATFCYPCINVGPSKELIEKGSQPKYKTVTREEFIRIFLSRKDKDEPFIEKLTI